MYFSISVVVTNDVAKVIALSSSDQGLALVYDGKISTPTGSILVQNLAETAPTPSWCNKIYMCSRSS